MRILILQGGINYTGYTDTISTFTFKRPFSNTNYQVLTTGLNARVNPVNIIKTSNSKMSFYSVDVKNYVSKVDFMWMAMGY